MSDEDKAYRTINGRRWRVSDPEIPALLHTQLVNALMDARRVVAAAKHSDDCSALSVARARVQAAKVALGERGPQWWQAMSEEELMQRAEATLFTLLEHRAADKTLCPSEVARATLSSAWRSLMPLVRDRLNQYGENGYVVVLQKGKPTTVEARGPIRIGRGERFADYFNAD